MEVVQRLGFEAGATVAVVHADGVGMSDALNWPTRASQAVGMRPLRDLLRAT